MSRTGWEELRELMIEVDSHRLTNTDVRLRDEMLYETVAEIRRRIS